MYKPLRIALKSLWREFKRCSFRYEPLLHELFVPAADFSDVSASDLLAGFREHYADLLGDGWQDWHVEADAAFFGRFTGSPVGLDEFKRLGESTYLALCQFEASLPRGRGYQGWLKVLHDMAHAYPTPLLRSEFDAWERPGESEDELYLAGRGDDEDVQFPLYPFYWKLCHNVFTSSMAAIYLLLDEDAALLVGDPMWTSEWPVRLAFCTFLRMATEVAEPACG